MTPGVAVAVGLVAAVAAALGIFVASARHRAGRTASPALIGALVLSVIAVMAFDQWLGRAESVYATLLIMTITLSASPFIVALYKSREAS